MNQLGGALRSEWIKQSSLKSVWVTVAIAVVLGCSFSALSMFGFSQMAEVSEEAFAVSPNLALAGPNQVVTIVVIVLGVLAVTGEYSSGTIQPTLQAVSARWPLGVAKALVSGAISAVCYLVAALSSLAIVVMMAQGSSVTTHLPAADVVATIGTGVVGTCLISVLSVGVAFLVRRAAAAIMGILLWTLLAESLLPLIPKVGEKLNEWMPFVNLQHFYTAGSSSSNADFGAMTLDREWWLSGLYFAAIAVVFLVLGTLSLLRRDAT